MSISRPSPLEDVRSVYARTIEAVRALPFDYRPNEPTPHGYYGHLLDEPSPLQREHVDRRIRYFRDVFEFAGRPPEGIAVLEGGSCFGLGLVLLACLGAAKVRGIEIVPWMVEFAQRARDILPPALRGRIEAVAGSVNDLPFADGEFDVILSLEAISHYLDYRPFLAEAHRVLRPGGVLVVSDGNNGLNPLIRSKTAAMWASHEVDPGPRSTDTDSPFLFVPRRQQIIEAAFPALEVEEAHRLALHTSGMVREQIVDAIRDYLETGRLPRGPYRRGELSIHPDHEVAMERLFNPYALGKEIESYGFRCKVRGHWAGASGKKLHRVAQRVLAAMGPLTIVTARGFRIAAYKI